MKRPQHKFLIASCLAGTQDQAYVARVLASKDFLNTASNTFDSYASRQMAYQFKEPTLSQTDPAQHLVSKADLITLYEQKLVKNASGRKLYQKIKGSAPDGLCQLCHVGLAETLDHYLPKEQFPSLSIAPFNLIPACLRCNKEKHTKVPSTEGEQTIHPYFDKAFYGSDWLEARIDPDTGVVSYSAHQGLSTIAVARVEHHLKYHGIGQLYSTKATAEVLQLARMLGEGAFPLSSEDARDEINTQYIRLERWRRDGFLTIKAWEVALYKCLLHANWFLQEGHGRILSYYKDREEDFQFEDALTEH